MNIPQNIRCHACGDAIMERVEEDQVFETTGRRQIKVPKFVFLRCPACGEETVPMASARTTSRVVAETMERMKADEVRQFLKLTKLTPEKASVKVGSSVEAVRAWLSGSYPAPSAQSILMRVFMARPEMLRLAGGRGAARAARSGMSRASTKDQQRKLVEKAK